MPVRSAGVEVGIVTSACLSPTLEKPIAMAYLEGSSETVEVTLGSRAVTAKVIALPFYKR